MKAEFSLYGCPACSWRDWVSPYDVPGRDEPVTARHDRESPDCDKSMPVMLVASVSTTVIERDSLTTPPPCGHYARGASGALRFCKLAAGHTGLHDLMT